jgi:hypothetical protein
VKQGIFFHRRGGGICRLWKLPGQAQEGNNISTIKKQLIPAINDEYLLNCYNDEV